VDDFPWGQIIETTKIGPYEIRAFHPRKVVGLIVSDEIDTAKINYHGFIDGKDTHRSWTSLDEAMAGVIVYRNLGPNSLTVAEHFIAGVNAVKAEREQ
jgi:hypothetical protein